MAEKQNQQSVVDLTQGNNQNPNPSVTTMTQGNNSNPSPSVTTICKNSKKRVRVGRKPAECWSFFDKVLINEVMHGKCKYCEKTFAASTRIHGTSNLNHHMLTCPKYPYREPEPGQPQLFLKKKDGEDVTSVLAFSFSIDNARKCLAEMIIVDELPFRFVEGFGFKKFCNALQPKFTKIPCRTTVARDVLRIYNDERESLKKLLVGKRVCLTTDTWTSIQNLNYMCLTCHFIDDDWVLQKRYLNFCLIEDHKGDTIGKKIESCLRGWNIDSFFTLTMDNASSNNTAIKFLQMATKDWKGTVMSHEFLHMRCCAHILNLIVGDALKDLVGSIRSIREAVRYVRSSPSRFLNFKRVKEMLGIESNSLLCLDVPTRWNSTYKMLDSAEMFEKVFDRLYVSDDKYSAHFLDIDLSPPTEKDWVNARCFVNFLSLFYHASKRFSGTLYVTSNLFFDEIFIIHAKIKELSKSGDKLLSTMASSMKSKFDKYWGSGVSINMLLYVAVVLDPRKRMSYIQFCFSEMYDKETSDALIVKVENTLKRLYSDYSSSHGTCVENVIDGSSNGIINIPKISENIDDPRKAIASRYQMFLEGKGTQSLGVRNELEKYLDENPDRDVDEGFDILRWWKNNSERFKILSRLARDVLAIPVSTVASESAFSTGGRVLDPFRSSLAPNTVEALICCQNWLRASVPISLRKSMDDIEEIEKDIGNCDMNLMLSEESILTQV